jgi:hypothetical protein
VLGVPHVLQRRSPALFPGVPQSHCV